MMWISRWLLRTGPGIAPSPYQVSQMAMHAPSSHYWRACPSFREDWQASEPEVDLGMSWTWCCTVTHWDGGPFATSPLGLLNSWKSAYVSLSTDLYRPGGGDSSVVRAPDSWLKGRGFESLLERRENFLLQGRLSVLTLISVSVPPPCYHSST